MSARKALGIGSVALGAGVALIAVLGPLLLGVIDYPVSQLMLNQLKGAQAAELVVIAPLGVLAGVMTLRGHRAGPALCLGPAIYAMYMLAEMVVGPEYLRRAGNSQRFFPLLLGVFVLAGIVAVSAWRAIEDRAAPLSRGRQRLLGRFLLPVGAFLVFSRYIPILMDVMGGRPTLPDYVEGPTIFWTIALEDLGIGLPAIVAACVLLAGARPGAMRLAYAVTGYLALVGASVAGMSIVMFVRDDPASSVTNLIMMTSFAAMFAGLAALVHAPLFRYPTPAEVDPLLVDRAA